MNIFRYCQWFFTKYTHLSPPHPHQVHSSPPFLTFDTTCNRSRGFIGKREKHLTLCNFLTVSQGEREHKSVYMCVCVYIYMYIYAKVSLTGWGQKPCCFQAITIHFHLQKKPSLCCLRFLFQFTISRNAIVKTGFSSTSSRCHEKPYVWAQEVSTCSLHLMRTHLHTDLRLESWLQVSI